MGLGRDAGIFPDRPAYKHKGGLTQKFSHLYAKKTIITSCRIMIDYG